MMRSVLLLCLLIFTSLPVFGVQIAPSVADAEAEAAVREKMPQYIQRLRSDTWETREAASKELVGLGVEALPVLREYADHDDPEVRARIENALRDIVLAHIGTAGQAVEGLRLAARPMVSDLEPGQVIPLKLTLINTTRHDIYILQHFWQLHIQPGDETGTNHFRIVSAGGNTQWHPMDFLRLKPGRQVVYTMDANPTADRMEKGRAYLAIFTPRNAYQAAPREDLVFSGSSELKSRVFTLQYREAEADETPDVEQVQAEPGAAGGLQPKAEDPMVVAQKGLQAKTPEDRWQMFESLCHDGSPEWQPLIIGFLERLGPRSRDSHLNALLEAYGQSLPRAQREEFYLKAAKAIAYDWRTVSMVADSLQYASDAATADLAARMYMVLCERGLQDGRTLNFVARRLLKSPDPAFRNPEKAREMAEEAVRQNPRDISCQLTLAQAQEDQEAVRNLVAQIDSAATLNDLAWDLATGERSSRDGKLAVLMAERANALTHHGEAAMLDTLAASYATAGRYAEALAKQEEAYAATSHATKPDFASRLARYVALAAEGATWDGDIFGKVRFTGDAARQALQARIAASEDRHIRSACRRLLSEACGE